MSQPHHQNHPRILAYLHQRLPIILLRDLLPTTTLTIAKIPPFQHLLVDLVRILLMRTRRMEFPNPCNVLFLDFHDSFHSRIPSNQLCAFQAESGDHVCDENLIARLCGDAVLVEFWKECEWDVGVDVAWDAVRYRVRDDFEFDSEFLWGI